MKDYHNKLLTFISSYRYNEKKTKFFPCVEKS